MGMNLPVKWYDNSIGGLTAPTTCANQIAFLDAVLVDGFNLVTLDSVVISGNVATATRSAGNHGFAPHQVIEIAGATPAALNGQWRVIDTTSTTFTFATTGISDQTATGTITCKTPAMGWERVFTDGALKRVYRSPNTDHCARSFFRFDGGHNTYGATLDPYIEMTDVDTGTGLWKHPSASSSYALPKSRDGRFLCVGDNKTMHLAVPVSNSSNNYDFTFTMGAFESFKPNDVDNDHYMGCSTVNGLANISGYDAFSLTVYDSSGLPYNNAIRRRALGDIPCRGLPMRWVNDNSGYGGPAYPEPFTNGLFVTPSMLRDIDYGGNPTRGRIRGCYWVLQDQPMYCPLPGINLDDIIGLEGRRCRLYLETGSNGSGGHIYKRGLIDITGPWD